MTNAEIVVDAVRELRRATKRQVCKHVGDELTEKQVSNALRMAVSAGLLVTTGKPIPGTMTTEATYRVKPPKPVIRHSSVWAYADSFAPKYGCADLSIPVFAANSDNTHRAA